MIVCKVSFEFSATDTYNYYSCRFLLNNLFFLQLLTHSLYCYCSLITVSDVLSYSIVINPILISRIPNIHLSIINLNLYRSPSFYYYNFNISIHNFVLQLVPSQPSIEVFKNAASMELLFSKDEVDGQ